MSKAEERSKEIIQAALDYANNLDDIKPTDELEEIFAYHLVRLL